MTLDRPRHPWYANAVPVGDRRSLAASFSGRPSLPGAGLPPCFTLAGFDGMAVGSQVLKDRVVLVIPTMLMA